MTRRLPIAVAAMILLAIPVLVAASPRSFVSANYSLELDGAPAGFVTSVQGGNAYAEVITEAQGPDYFVRKHVGPPKYEEFQIQVGLDMSGPIYDWIASSWRGEPSRKNGAVAVSDFNFVALSKREFQNALITETTIPAMDAASKDPGYLTVKLAPEMVRYVRPSGGKTPAPTAKPKAKQWLPSNFRLKIDGLNTSRVSKIDAITVKQSVVHDEVGAARDSLRAPAKLEFPNLTLTLSGTEAADWIAWHEDFVIKGNNGQEKERKGTLSLMAADRKQVLATVSLYNLGIVSIKEVPADSGGANTLQYKVELYVERMEFEIPGVR